MNRSVVFLVVLLASKGYSQEHHLILNHRLWRIQEQHELNQSEFDEKVAKGMRVVVQHAPGFLGGVWIFNNVLQKSAYDLQNTCRTQIVNTTGEWCEAGVGLAMMMAGCFPMVLGIFDICDSGLCCREDCGQKCYTICVQECCDFWFRCR